MTIETMKGNSKQKTEKNHTSFHLTAHESLKHGFVAPPPLLI